MSKSNVAYANDHVFTGNLYIFHAFDIGEEINLDKIRESRVLSERPLKLPNYFKNYHIPLSVDLPGSVGQFHCINVKIYNFGVVSLMYKVPFESTLEALREKLNDIDDRCQKQSLVDVETLFKHIKAHTTKINFFQTQSTYLIIQVDTTDTSIDTTILKERYGSVIASALRFETEMLSEYQKNEIIESATGYFRGDFIIIDTEAAFIYDAEFDEVRDLFEYANIQHLELRYFDRVLDHQMNLIYEDALHKIPLRSYLPFIGTLSSNQVDELGKLKVDISVVAERLENGIKLGGNPYFAELYALLDDRLDLTNWKVTIEKKLAIVTDIRSVLQHKIDSIREDLLTSLIIVLIVIELIVAIMH
ncbi:hypothetical protein JST99_03630 [Candidatus Dependentiae bacterium]|nr:hypothetical protein [Candidatus Dependentiae bacterium]MCC7414500.1 hypothetical protein [Campylobacterota bacterium]